MSEVRAVRCLNKSFTLFIQSLQVSAAHDVFSTCSSIQGSAVQSSLKVP